MSFGSFSSQPSDIWSLRQTSEPMALGRSPKSSAQTSMVEHAAQQFEAVFVKSMLDSAFKDGFGGMGDSGQADQIKSLWTEKLSTSVTSGEGLGLKKSLVDALSGVKTESSTGAGSALSLETGQTSALPLNPREGGSPPTVSVPLPMIKLRAAQSETPNLMSLTPSGKSQALSDPSQTPVKPSTEAQQLKGVAPAIDTASAAVEMTKTHSVDVEEKSQLNANEQQRIAQSRSFVPAPEIFLAGSNQRYSVADVRSHKVNPVAPIQAASQAALSSADSGEVHRVSLARAALEKHVPEVDMPPFTPEKQPCFDDPDDFISMLRPCFEEAAQELGVSPRILMAQAALETGWGKHLPSDGEAVSFNLFGIKANRSWQGEAVRSNTVEFTDGVAASSSEPFRRYTDYAESVRDYVRFIQEQPRYAAALEHGGSDERYIQAIADAGYATDPQYAARVLQVADSPRLSVLSPTESAHDTAI